MQQRRQAWHCTGLGSFRFARRYSGNRCCFLFLRVLRWFTSPGWLPSGYGFTRQITPVYGAGFPHSDIRGSLGVCPSPRLLAAYHVLPRLHAPRHPPCALSSLPNSSAHVLLRASSRLSLDTRAPSSFFSSPIRLSKSLDVAVEVLPRLTCARTAREKPKNIVRSKRPWWR